MSFLKKSRAGGFDYAQPAKLATLRALSVVEGQYRTRPAAAPLELIDPGQHGNLQGYPGNLANC